MQPLAARAWPVVVLAARLGIGGLFTAHGLMRLLITGADATAAALESAGVPAADLAAVLMIGIETSCGLLLAAGFLLPVAGILLAVRMLAAWWFVHRHAGFWAVDGGYETALGLGAAALLIGFSGGGALALDRALRRNR